MPNGYAIVITNAPLTINTDHRFDMQERGPSNYRYVYPLEGRITRVRIDGQEYDVRDPKEIVLIYEGSL